MTHTVTHYQKMADRCREYLDAIIREIPRLQHAHPQHTAFVRSRRTVPVDFILSMAWSVEHDDELQRLNTLDPLKAYDAVQFNEAFRPFRDQLAALVNALTYTMEVRHADAAEAALITYAMTKGLARVPGSPHVQTLAALSRDLHRAGRRGRRKKSGEDPEE